MSNYKLERKFVQDNYNLNEQDSIIMEKFTGKSSQTNTVVYFSKKTYNKIIVNKWHVILFLERNKSLLKYRSHHHEHRNLKVNGLQNDSKKQT